MISSLRPQMFYFAPNYFWVNQFPFNSFVPEVFDLPQEQKQHQELTATVSKQREGEKDEHSKEPKRRTWTVDEDQRLLQIIELMNFSEGKRLPYHKIAKQFKGRTSKQIRQRYLNHLNKSINKNPFTKEQDATVLKYYTQNGPKWKNLSLIMKGRTPTALKNRFNTKLKQALTLCQDLSQPSSQKVPTSFKQFQQNSPSTLREQYISQESS